MTPSMLHPATEGLLKELLQAERELSAEMKAAERKHLEMQAEGQFNLERRLQAVDEFAPSKLENRRGETRNNVRAAVAKYRNKVRRSAIIEFDPPHGLVQGTNLQKNRSVAELFDDFAGARLELTSAISEFKVMRLSTGYKLVRLLASFFVATVFFAILTIGLAIIGEFLVLNRPSFSNSAWGTGAVYVLLAIWLGSFVIFWMLLFKRWTKFDTRRGGIVDRFRAAYGKFETVASVAIDVAFLTANRETRVAHEDAERHRVNAEETRQSNICTARDAWKSKHRSLEADLATIGTHYSLIAPGLRDTDGASWRVASQFPDALRAGVISWEYGEGFRIPTLFPLPQVLPLGIEATGEARDHASRLLEMILLKLLIHTPPGRIRFTLIDAVGRGQAFATFMHLVDSERREKANEEAIGRRIWTESRQIDERLDELTTEMELRIQQRLGKRFADIHEYNAQAVTPLAWVVLGVANFPHGFSDDAARRLLSIAEHGARTGVFVALTWDTEAKLPYEFQASNLRNALSLCTVDGEHLVIPGLGQQWNVEPDLPEPATIEAILERLALEIPKGSIVEIPFADMRPEPDSWSTATTRDAISVPIGLAGARKRQLFEMSNERSAYHGVMVGQTGSGKSMLLHVLILNLALTYSPDELELYMIDFKEGVEFKLYAEKKLPQARVIAIRSEPEFGLSVLEGLADELSRRGELFRQAAETHGEVKDLSSYRSRTGKNLPRILLIIDEFQVMFAEENAISRRAVQLIELIARQGRSAGVHMLLVSQTLSGSSALSKATLGQMSIRIALRCSDGDARLVLDDDNPGARELIRPGEGLYNDGSGKIESNSTFQVAFLSKETADRETALNELARRTVEWRAATGAQPLPLKVFEGDADADISACSELIAAISGATPTDIRRTNLWLGEPVAIKDSTAASLRRQSRSHLLIVGQDEVASRGMLEAVALSIIAQHPRPASGPPITVIDTTPVDDDFATRWQDVAGCFPNHIQVASRRTVAPMIDELWRELERRETADLTREPVLALVVHGVARARDLKREGGFVGGFGGGFGSALDAPPAPSAGEQFAKLLRNGPEYGIHVVAWTDTLGNFNRILERNSLDEFDQRVALQVSTDDSSQLIDTPAAGKLGLHRALLFSEEASRLEKFRPFGMVALEWIRGAQG